jgi:small conductance mechanosensitive channel
MEKIQQLLGQLDPSLITNTIMEYGISILSAIAIYIIGKWLVTRISRLIKKAMASRGVEQTLVKFLGNIVHWLLLAFVIIAALTQLGVETTSIAAIFAAAGLAIGLALKDSLSNFASGVMIILFRTFKVGDFVEIAGTSGTVEEVSIFTTHLKTPDNKLVIVPNSSITSGTITNYSAMPTRRIDMVFGIGYQDDIRKAKSLLEEILASDERILKDPAPVVAVSELADSSVNFVVRPWAKKEDYWGVYWDLQENVKLRFDEAGISIPFPQQEVHMHTLNAA